MTDLAWEPISFEGAANLMATYWVKPEEVLGSLQDSAMHNVDDAPLVSIRTPWRFIRYNPVKDCFETAPVA